jgi:glutathione S-transferase
MAVSLPSGQSTGRRDEEKNMITLHVFGPAFGLPDPSPFCTKADMLLKLSGLPYKAVPGNLNKAPKGKLPVMNDDGAVIADSTFIRQHLEAKHGIDFDKGLTPEQKGIAWAVEKMLEDHLYWAVVSERWMDDANFDRGPRYFFNAAPAPIRPLVIAMVRRKVKRNLWGQGLGRHSRPELVQLGTRAIDALAGILGDKPYLTGATPCGADAALAAFVMSLLCPLFTTELRTATERHANLVAYAARIRAEFYPELAEVKAA